MSDYLLASGEIAYLLHLLVIFRSLSPAERAWGYHFQYVSMSIADTIFLKFHIKLKALNYQNLRKSNFPDELDFSGEKPKKFLKNRGFFLAFSKNSIIWCIFFYPKNGTLQGCLWFSESFLSGKSLVAKWCKTNQIAGFFDHQHLWKE